MYLINHSWGSPYPGEEARLTQTVSEVGHSRPEEQLDFNTHQVDAKEIGNALLRVKEGPKHLRVDSSILQCRNSLLAEIRIKQLSCCPLPDTANNFLKILIKEIGVKRCAQA